MRQYQGRHYTGVWGVITRNFQSFLRREIFAVCRFAATEMPEILGSLCFSLRESELGGHIALVHLPETFPYSQI